MARAGDGGAGGGGPTSATLGTVDDEAFETLAAEIREVKSHWFLISVDLENTKFQSSYSHSSLAFLLPNLVVPIIQPNLAY